MYLEHFGLKEKPFNITPNPQFIFLSKNHKEVFAHLLYGLQSRCGFIEITGEVGAGKTTVLRTLFEQMSDDEFRLAFIFNPSLSAEELLFEICRELGIETGSSRGGQLLPLINRFLLDENAAGRTVVLVIDEAQNLAAPVLEQIRLLSNLETETDKLIQIILVGQPELADVLSRTNLRQLNQRISIRYHLRPMDEQDSAAYVRHRLQVAGLVDGELFTGTALKLIYRHSTGLPRLINILADRSLLAAFSEDRKVVGGPEVKTALSELRRAGRYDRKRSFIRGTLAFCLGALLLAALSFLVPRFYGHDAVSVVSDEIGSPAPRITPTQERVTVNFAAIDALRKDLAARTEAETFNSAATALSDRWQAEFVDTLDPGFDSQAFVAALELNGWQWTAFSGDFDRLLSFDTPALLELVLPGVPGRRYLAVTGVEGGLCTVFPPVAHRTILSQDELRALYSGKAFLVWKNYLDIGYYAAPGISASDIREIQSMLKTFGIANIELSGVYDRQTIEAVTRFQATQGISQDGRVGPLTLLLLYRQSGYFNPPRLKGAGQS